MTLKQQWLDVLAAQGPIQGGSQRVEAREGPLRLECELTAVDRLACAFRHLTLYSQPLETAEIDVLSRVAERLAERLTYLLEPIQPLEVDPQQCVVQMRSVPPTQDEQGTTYYELTVRRGGQLSLCRYAYEPGAGRQQISAEVTREVLARLVDDFATVALPG